MSKAIDEVVADVEATVACVEAEVHAAAVDVVDRTSAMFRSMGLRVLAAGLISLLAWLAPAAFGQHQSRFWVGFSVGGATFAAIIGFGFLATAHQIRRTAAELQ